MKKFLYSISLALCMFLSCEEIDFDKVCDVQDPATELGWLQDLIEDRDSPYKNEISYFSFSYNGNFYIQDVYCGNSLILWASTYYNCQGREINFSSTDRERIGMLAIQEIWKGVDCD